MHQKGALAPILLELGLAALLLKIQKPRFREQLGRPQQALLQQLGPRVDVAINS